MKKERNGDRSLAVRELVRLAEELVLCGPEEG
jgi:hypothetical protein